MNDNESMEETEQEQPLAAKHPGGRPTDYKPEFCEIAANLATAGCTDFEIAEVLEVHIATFYRWQGKHPEFRDALKFGKEACDQRVERALYHRAVGYSHAAVKVLQHNGKPLVIPYTEHFAPDVGAATFWLTNRKGDDWKAKQSLEHTGLNGGPIAVKNADDITDDQLAAIAAGAHAHKGPEQFGQTQPLTDTSGSSPAPAKSTERQT